MESTQSTAILPKLFKWLFAILEVCAGLAAVGLIVVLIVNPTLPPGAHVGPVTGDVLGQPAQFELAPAGGTADTPTFRATLFNNTVALTENDPAGLLDLLKQYGLPLAIIHVLFAVALFDILRRLFRNVGRGESFTPGTVRLVQIIGGGLIGYSVIAAVGEAWFAHAIFGYLAEHTNVTVAGAPVHLPAAHTSGHFPFWLRGRGLFLGHAAFWSGLLVLALAEVFRQGLALKRDAELTV